MNMICAFFWQLTNWYPERTSFPKDEQELCMQWSVLNHSNHSFKGKFFNILECHKKGIWSSRSVLAHFASEKKKVLVFFPLSYYLWYCYCLSLPTFSNMVSFQPSCSFWLQKPTHEVMPFTTHWGMLFQWFAVQCYIKLFIRQSLVYLLQCS